MRVIGGLARGRKLQPVPGNTTRPITSRVKKALFDILGGLVLDSRFLDLYAGTGSVGIEALSRGAAECVFVDKNPRAVATIRQNLASTGLTRQAMVVRQSVGQFITEYAPKEFDLIYLAPPQYRGLWVDTLQALDHSSLLAPEGLIVTQIYPKEYHPLSLDSLELSEQRKYGSTLLCFYEVALSR